MNRILIADDEPLARARLRALLESMEQVEVVAEAENGQQVLERLRQTPQIDIVLLDIRMPGMDGMQAAAELRRQHASLVVIFTTAYPDHALEAYRHQALAYLLKPVRRQALEEALEQARVVIAGHRWLENEQQQFIHAQVRGRLVRIPLHEIPYLQASHKYVQLKHQGHEVLVEDSLVQLEQRFPGAFLRIHRNALVNPRYIQGLERDTSGRHWLLLRDMEEKLEISRRNLPAVRQFIKGM